MNKITTSIILVLILCLQLSSISGLIASISNPRMVLYKNMTESPLIFDNSVTINNDNNFSVIISLVARAELKDIVNIEENEFNLAPGESKEAFYTFNIKKAGVYDGEILVTFKGENNELTLAQKIVVAVQDNSGNSRMKQWLIILTLTLAVLLIASIILLRYYKLNKNRRKMR